MIEFKLENWKYNSSIPKPTYVASQTLLKIDTLLKEVKWYIEKRKFIPEDNYKLLNVQNQLQDLLWDFQSPRGHKEKNKLIARKTLIQKISSFFRISRV